MVCMSQDTSPCTNVKKLLIRLTLRLNFEQINIIRWWFTFTLLFVFIGRKVKQLSISSIRMWIILHIAPTPPFWNSRIWWTFSASLQQRILPIFGGKWMNPLKVDFSTEMPCKIKKNNNISRYNLILNSCQCIC